VSIAYLEREREVSVMVALGSRLRRIAGMFTMENIIVTLLAVIPGLLAGYLLAVFMMKIFSTEFFSAPAVIRPISYVITVLGILVVVLLAEIPSLRRAKHMDVASMIRESTR
jgi:ABC-type antimicrobial peptide transport system permease subunit